MRVLGLDYGTVTVGVAVSDRLGITAQEQEAKGIEFAINRICGIT